VLTLLSIKNIALIDHLSIEFGEGLNLLTGETGSGKSIIVDSLGALTGARISADLIKSGQASGSIEGLFSIETSTSLLRMLDDAGIEADGGEIELIVRRELSSSGKNRIYVNSRLVTQAFLRSLGTYLADIHGQGEQADLYSTGSHIRMLDRFARTGDQLTALVAAFKVVSEVREEIAALERDESEKLQMMDILRFQIEEISRLGLEPDEDTVLEEEKRRLNNVEKLTTLSSQTFDLLYDNSDSTMATLDRSIRNIEELSAYDVRFADYSEGLASARATIEDLAISVRDFKSGLEFSPDRLEEIESRLAEISNLKRKYGGTLGNVLEHLDVSQKRLEDIETSEYRRAELQTRHGELLANYRKLADKLHEVRVSAAAKFEKQVEKDLESVALDKARFEVRIDKAEDESGFTASGYDKIEFYFSANPGEDAKPLARIVSGGEASRLMLILKTTGGSERSRTSVFDEIDVGIGGRVAEAVGRKLKGLSSTQQVFCVTHQPQIASLADKHFLVEKEMSGSRTTVYARELNAGERVEEIARMLAGETVTDAARENAKAMLASN
jgi:DNA repair protein RecN (Recombination protein N)